MTGPMLTPPPYHLGQAIQVRCPICTDLRWIQYDSKYRRPGFTGRCRACGQRQRQGVLSAATRRRRMQHIRQTRQRWKDALAVQHYGKPWKPSVLECYYEKGYSLRETGQVLHMSRQTVRGDLVKWGYPRRPKGGDTRKYQRRVTDHAYIGA